MAHLPLKTTDEQCSVNAKTNYFNSQLLAVFSLTRVLLMLYYIAVYHPGAADTQFARK